jgi:hypothetical protein
MKARRLIDGAAFGPETLKAVGEAFDQAWAQIAGNFGDSPTQVENARLRLAKAMLSIATEDSTDVAALKAGALQAMAMDYRSGIRVPLHPALQPHPRQNHARRRRLAPRTQVGRLPPAVGQAWPNPTRRRRGSCGALPGRVLLAAG